MFEVLPPLRACDALALTSGDLYIAAAGFEDRALAGARLLKPAAGSHALVIDYRPMNPRNKLSELHAALQGAGVAAGNIIPIEYDRRRPEPFASQFRSVLANRRIRRVVLDASAMSKLLLILGVVTAIDAAVDATVLYVEAQTYGPSEDDYLRARAGGTIQRPSLRVDTGLHSVVRTTVTSSVAMQGQPCVAVAFMSFNELHTQALLNAVSPAKLLLINGRPPTLGWREHATAWIHEQLRSEWPAGDNPVLQDPTTSAELPSRRTSTLEYRETLALLEDLYWEHATRYRFVLAPTGSKMQALACALFRAIHVDVHVEYPTPSGFLDTYSRGSGQAWVIEFGRLSAVRQQLVERTRRARILI